MRLAFLVVLSCLAGACDSYEQEGNELSLLMQRVQGYTDSTDEEQRAQLEALRRFEPSTDRVKEARDACLDAYTLVESAERDHLEARHMLEEVTAGRGDLAKSRPEIEKRITRSNEAIDGARPRIKRCTRLLSDLKREHQLHR